MSSTIMAQGYLANICSIERWNTLLAELILNGILRNLYHLNGVLKVVRVMTYCLGRRASS